MLKTNIIKILNIEYWGSSELIDRLSNEDNSGLRSFFFGQIDLSNKWFKNQNELAIADLGARYTPEINVELDVIKNFDALSRNVKFKNRLDNLYHETMVSYRKFFKHLENKEDVLQTSLESLNSSLKSFEGLYYSIVFDGISYIDLEKVFSLLEEITILLDGLQDSLFELNRKEIKEQKIEITDGYRKSTKYDRHIRYIEEFASSFYEFKGVLNSNALRFMNNPFMILNGDAGMGKSHLLADVVNERIKSNSNSVFLLGQHFRENRNPWSQILDILDLRKFSKEEFLGALNTKAELQNKRIIIFIDAINEGKGREFWDEFLISFIESIKKYEWLGLVISVRSSYYELIIPEKIFEDSLAIPITHHGFEGIEYNASKLFFENYDILQSSVPLLNPEFSNPLFLKLFCEGLNKKGYKYIPDGYEGITQIIKFFVGGIEEKLLKKYPNIKSLKLIEKTINLFIPLVLNNQSIAYSDALAAFIEHIESKWRINPEFLDDLITEGLFTRNLFYNYDTKEHEERIYFVYERFEDHLKVKYLFDNYLDKDNPKESFKKEPLYSYFDESKNYFNRGLIDAMSIQLPEIIPFEILDVTEHNEFIIKSFLDSLLWRKVESITTQTVSRLMRNIDNEYFSEDIYNILLSVSSNPNHPLNADLLFEHLSKYSMRDRDLFLSPLLNNIYLRGETNSITRLIDWAWSDEDKRYISNESALLTASTLAWFLTSTNRKLRDYSTKAMISLLQNRVNVVNDLLKKFEDIYEPYIYERLFAIAYGVVIRVEKYDNLKELAIYICNTIFDKDEVYPHILLRDYAKSIIDYINYLNIKLDIDFEKIKPPYKSFFPKINELPTNEDINKYQDRDKNYHQSDIISSMMTEYGNGKGYGGYGDFGRYVFGSAMHHFECKKNQQLISNFATKKIFEEYGYDGELFDNVENTLNRINRNYDRYNHNIERLGKKYQWISFYDVMARVTDNFDMFDSSSWDNEKKLLYSGSFEPSVRDIDPTILIKETKTNRKSKEKFWWTPRINIDWSIDNDNWIKLIKDVPNPNKLLEFTDFNDKKWIALISFPEWDEPISKGYDKRETTYKDIWYQFRSYLVPKKELSTFTKWAERQWFWNDWMPREEGQYQMFSREHYWSECYSFFQNPYYSGYEDWTNITRDRGEEKYPYKIGMTVAKYYWEEEFDYSKDSSFNILKPSKLIFEGLNMKYSNKDGEFLDKNNKLICFETSVHNETHQCLLVREEELFEFLDKNELTLVWTVIGEKQTHSPLSHRNKFGGYLQISGYSYLDEDKKSNSFLNFRLMDKDRKTTYKNEKY